MARRGASYQQILAKYFPGTGVGTDAETRRRGEGEIGGRGDGETERSSDGARQTGPELTGVRSLRLEHLAGQERWFTPACLAMGVGGGKPPFLTCEFTQPERFSKSALRQRRDHRPISLSPRPFVTSHHAVSASPRPPLAQSPRRPVSSPRRTLASEHFRVSYPNIDEQQAEQMLSILESSRTDLIRRVSAAGVSVQVPTLELFINETTGDFVGRTGQPPWAAAATSGSRVELQPLELLKRRRILETTLRHELVHVVIDAMGQGRTPRWLAEGLALHYAGEGQLVSRYQRKTEIAISELEQRLSQPASAAEMRAAYAAAYREVKRLIRAEGEAAVWRRASQRS